MMAIRPMASIAVWAEETETVSVSAVSSTWLHYWEAEKPPWHFPRTWSFPDLPLADVLHPLTKGPLQAGAQLQGVTADLDDVVDKSTHGRQGERRGEENHISKLDEHLLIVLKGVLQKSISLLSNHLTRKQPLTGDQWHWKWSLSDRHQLAKQTCHLVWRSPMRKN